MKKIFKYELRVMGLNQLEIPKGHQVLTVQMQKGIMCLWVLVDPEETTQEIRIVVVGTGHPIESNLHYIGTVQQLGGSLMWHVFEEM